MAALRRAGCVFAEDEAALLLETARSGDELQAMVSRRCAGEPLEHVLGWVAFSGLRLHVAPGVFVPRRRSELLAAGAVAVARGVGPEAVVVDLCCGCGAIAAVVAAELPTAEVHAVEIDPVAAACARRNLPGAAVYCGDLFAVLPPELRGRVDVLVANAPYVPSDAVDYMPAEARLHEPRAALDGGGDGLDVHRRIAADALDWLAPLGRLILEMAEAQVASAFAFLDSAGLTAEAIRSDTLDATIVVAAPRRRGR